MENTSHGLCRKKDDRPQSTDICTTILFYCNYRNRNSVCHLGQIMRPCQGGSHCHSSEFQNVSCHHFSMLHLSEMLSEIRFDLFHNVILL